jgi:hypothetical protein
VIAGGTTEESWHALVVAIKVNRAVLARPWFTGICRHHLAVLVEELARP